MHFTEKSDRENIDGQHPRPPVLAILLEIIERDGSFKSKIKKKIKKLKKKKIQKITEI